MRRVPANATSYTWTTVGSAHVSLWPGGVSLRAIERLEEQLLDRVGATGQVDALLVVWPGELPDAAARSRTLEMLRTLGARLNSVAIVVEGRGFRASATRSMFTGLALVLRPGFEWSFFATTEVAAEWQCSRVQQASSAALVASVDGLKRGWAEAVEPERE